MKFQVASKGEQSRALQRARENVGVYESRKTISDLVSRASLLYRTKLTTERLVSFAPDYNMNRLHCSLVSVQKDLPNN